MISMIYDLDLSCRVVALGRASCVRLQVTLNALRKRMDSSARGTDGLRHRSPGAVIVVARGHVSCFNRSPSVSTMSRSIQLDSPCKSSNREEMRVFLT